jgi:hypothetical protein
MLSGNPETTVLVTCNHDFSEPLWNAKIHLAGVVNQSDMTTQTTPDWRPHTHKLRDIHIFPFVKKANAMFACI